MNLEPLEHSDYLNVEERERKRQRLFLSFFESQNVMGRTISGEGVEKITFSFRQTFPFPMKIN